MTIKKLKCEAVPSVTPVGDNRSRDWKRVSQALGFGSLLGLALAPSQARACACGCGVFDVGTSSMFPQGAGGMLFTDFDYQDQNRNWSGDSRAPAANNGDKEIKTFFVTQGVQYFFDRAWGIQVEVPYAYRGFKTDSSDPNANGAAYWSHWGSLGDIRVEGIYTGFSDDLSTGLTLGLKLPTGNFSHNNAFGDIDRDSEIGTGSTDILLGAFHRQQFAKGSDWNWYAQALLDVPTLIQGSYRPGLEVDAAAGIYYEGWSIGRLRISPIAQVIGSFRTSDSGNDASGGENDGPVGEKDSGYERLMLSPGIEFHLHPISVYADAEFPVYQHFTGNQLAAPALFKVVVSYMF